MIALFLAPVARTTASDELYLRGGRLVTIAGGVRLNFVCAGHGAPTVVFDAGLEDWSPAWSKVQPAIAAGSRTCSYDRAGSGASSAGRGPRTSGAIVTELHEALTAAGERPPYIVVGHSFGGYNMRLFADRYLDEVAGIVLVDSSHEDQAALIKAVDPASDAAYRAMLVQLRRCHDLAAAGRLALRTAAGRACAGQFFRGLPERTFSSRLNALLLRQALAAKQFAASRSEAENFATRSADDVRRARRSYGAVPLRILTAMQHFVDTPRTPAARRRGEQRFERGWEALQRSWLALSSDALQTPAQHSGHYVQLDRPELVIAAIRAEIRIARK